MHGRVEAESADNTRANEEGDRLPIIRVRRIARQIGGPTPSPRIVCESVTNVRIFGNKKRIVQIDEIAGARPPECRANKED